MSVVRSVDHEEKRQKIRQEYVADLCEIFPGQSQDVIAYLSDLPDETLQALRGHAGGAHRSCHRGMKIAFAGAALGAVCWYLGENGAAAAAGLAFVAGTVQTVRANRRLDVLENGIQVQAAALKNE